MKYLLILLLFIFIQISCSSAIQKVSYRLNDDHKQLILIETKVSNKISIKSNECLSKALIVTTDRINYYNSCIQLDFEKASKIADEIESIKKLDKTLASSLLDKYKNAPKELDDVLLSITQIEQRISKLKEEIKWTF